MERRSRILKISPAQRLYIMSILEKNNQGDVRIFDVKKSDLSVYDDQKDSNQFIPLSDEWFDVEDVFYWNGEFCFVEQVEKQSKKGTVVSFSTLECFSDAPKPKQ